MLSLDNTRLFSRESPISYHTVSEPMLENVTDRFVFMCTSSDRRRPADGQHGAREPDHRRHGLDIPLCADFRRVGRREAGVGAAEISVDGERGEGEDLLGQKSHSGRVRFSLGIPPHQGLPICDVHILPYRILDPASKLSQN